MFYSIFNHALNSNSTFKMRRKMLMKGWERRKALRYFSFKYLFVHLKGQ